MGDWDGNAKENGSTAVPYSNGAGGKKVKDGTMDLTNLWRNIMYLSYSLVRKKKQKEICFKSRIYVIVNSIFDINLVQISPK